MSRTKLSCRVTKRKRTDPSAGMYRALGRKDEAREILWREFSLLLSTSTFEKILELTRDVDRAQARQRAAALAENHRSPEQGAYFLTPTDELERAAELV